MTTWNDISNLTPAQRTLLGNYETKAKARVDERGIGGGGPPDAAQTFAQAKQVDVLCREIMTLVGMAQREAQFVMEHHRREALNALERQPGAPV